MAQEAIPLVLDQPSVVEQIRTAEYKVERAEVECLAKTIYFESRGESIQGQMAVAWVTLNRVTSKKFPSTICGVVHQPYQYSWVKQNNKVIGILGYVKATELARTMMEIYGAGLVPKELRHVRNALYFDSLIPRGNHVRIGNHNFR